MKKDKKPAYGVSPRFLSRREPEGRFFMIFTNSKKPEIIAKKFPAVRRNLV